MLDIQQLQIDSILSNNNLSESDKQLAVSRVIQLNKKTGLYECNLQFIKLIKDDGTSN